MGRKIVLVVRDYCYRCWLKKVKDPTLARRQQKQMVIALLACWYLALWTTLAVISFKMNWPFLPRTTNFFLKVVYGGLMFGPYVTFMWWWLDTLDDVPVDENVSYRRQSIITWSVAATGFLVAVLLPPLLQEVLP